MSESGGNILTVQLESGGPWGFRLSGGRHIGDELIVAKVRTKSKAFGALEEGDIVKQMNHIPAADLSYDIAANILDTLETNMPLRLQVSRSVANIHANLTGSQQPKARSLSAGKRENQHHNQATITPVAMTTPNAPLQPTGTKSNAFQQQKSNIAQQTQADPDRKSTLDDEETRNENHREIKIERWQEIKPQKILVSTNQDGDRAPAYVIGKREPNGTLPRRMPTFHVTKIASSSARQVWTPSQGSYAPSALSQASAGSTATDATSSVSLGSSYCSGMQSSSGLGSPVTTVPFPGTTAPQSTELPADDPPSAAKQRPVSMPDIDFNMASFKLPELSDTLASLGQPSQSNVPSEPQPVSLNRDERMQHMLKAFQPPPNLDQIEQEIRMRKQQTKMFTSSSFYKHPNNLYPTVQEQVDLCRMISESLSDDTNNQSKGQTMYDKRKKKADKWVFEGPDPVSGSERTAEQENQPPRGMFNGLTPTTPSHRDRPKLKLVLDPRQLQDAMKLRKSGLFNEHMNVSPDICFDLVRDLNSPKGKGGQLFAKRKKKSESWVVDETTVKQSNEIQMLSNAVIQAAQRKPQADMQPFMPPLEPLMLPPPILMNIVPGEVPPAPPMPQKQQPQVQQNKALNMQGSLYKMPAIQPGIQMAPWKAALEDPTGRCNSATREDKYGLQSTQQWAPPPLKSVAPQRSASFKSPQQQHPMYRSKSPAYDNRVPKPWEGQPYQSPGQGNWNTLPRSKSQKTFPTQYQQNFQAPKVLPNQVQWPPVQQPALYQAPPPIQMPAPLMQMVPPPMQMAPPLFHMGPPPAIPDLPQLPSQPQRLATQPPTGGSGMNYQNYNYNSKATSWSNFQAQHRQRMADINSGNIRPISLHA